MIAVLVLSCICMKKRRKRKEEEKRILGYYMAPVGRIEGQGDGNGMFYLFLIFRRSLLARFPLDFSHWGFEAKAV